MTFNEFNFSLSLIALSLSLSLSLSPRNTDYTESRGSENTKLSLTKIPSFVSWTVAVEVAYQELYANSWDVNIRTAGCTRYRPENAEALCYNLEDRAFSSDKVIELFEFTWCLQSHYGPVVDSAFNGNQC
jgi:hypothetical protein